MSFDPGLPDDSVNVSGTHPLREAALLVAGIAGAVALLALGLALAVDLLAPRLPSGVETALFSGWLPGEETEPGDDPERAGLQALVERLARHAPPGPYRFRAAVWELDDPNAFALPGGGLVVTRGLLDEMTSENELAFVVGHELGHFEHRDHLRGLGRGLALGLVLAAAGIAQAGPVADLVALAGQLAQRRFDRQQERAADAFGLELLAAEYGHVLGAGEFFAPDPGRGGLADRLAGYLSTHPLHAERAAALAALAQQRGWPREGSLTPLPDWRADDAPP